MPFPMVHLRVADRVARRLFLDDLQTAALLVGALAPDGVHYRRGLEGAAQGDIGAAKKISHLCLPNGEPWGYVRDSEAWTAEVCRIHAVWQGENSGPSADYFAMGYIVHVLTDVYCNMTLWKDFRTNYPDEAAKGYASDYYRELPMLDLALYQEEETQRVLRLLPLAVPRGFPGRVSTEEATAVRDSIFAEENGQYASYINRPPADTSANRLVTAAMMRDFIEGAVAFILPLI